MISSFFFSCVWISSGEEKKWIPSLTENGCVFVLLWYFFFIFFFWHGEFLLWVSLFCIYYREDSSGGFWGRVLQKEKERKVTRMTKSTNWNSSIQRILGGIDTHTQHTQNSLIYMYICIYISSSNRYLARKVVSAPVTTEEVLQKKKRPRERS